MKMMKEEMIEAAHREISRLMDFYPGMRHHVKNARDHLDALCAAAREPESLVGKRVRFKDNWAEMGVVLEENLVRMQPNLNPDFNSIVRRDDLELLEDDDEG